MNLNRNIKEKSTLPAFIERLKNQGNVKNRQLKQVEAAVKLYKGKEGTVQSNDPLFDKIDHKPGYGLLGKPALAFNRLIVITTS